MPAPLIVVGIATAVLAKFAASVWFSSRSTSPLSQPWREEYLDHLREEIDILEAQKLAPVERITQLRADYALLKANVAKGWGNADVFDAASRVSYYRGLKHTTTGLNGIAELAGSYIERTANRAYDAVCEAFTPPSRESE
jgi:hypothetical protein